MKQEKKMTGVTLAFIAFSFVWGFGNIMNGFVYFNGIQVIFSWILMFALYFVPYALMVGELGSAFKESGGGVSSWIHSTMGKKFAYYAGWTYWAVHITYIASKSSGGLKALSWAIFQKAEAYDELDTRLVQLVTFIVLIVFCYIASKGLSPLKVMTTVAGTSMFVMSLLYILMMFAAPIINPNASYVTLDFSLDNLIPNFNLGYFTNLSILVFAVGGCEKISPYVNKMKDPSKNFPKGMIFLAIMVVICAILGTISMGLMFDPSVINATEESFDSYVSNGSYWAFQKLGQYYHVGNALMVVYALCNVVGQFSTLLLSIDAPLRILLGNEDSKEFIPSGLLKQNKNGAYVNGIKMVAILSGAIIVAQSFVPGAAKVLSQLNKLNSVCMPMRYLWVFAAYIALRIYNDKFSPEYRFVKNRVFGIIFGAWCFIVTAACCILGVYSDDPLTLGLNIITPFVLIALGLILPLIADRERKAGKRVA